MSGESTNSSDPGESVDSGESLSAELEEALREATESVDASRAKAQGDESDSSDESDSPGGDQKLSADQMTIELLSQELGSIKDEYEARVAELDELKDRSVRQQAEFENFRRRSMKERQEAHQFGHQNLVKDLLPTVDNLERAVEHAEGNEDGNLAGLLQGVGLVLREFLAALKKHSVTVVGSQDQTFNPAIHEAVGQIPDASVPPNTVAHVLQKGYQLHDRMLRPARVMVTRVPDEDPGDGSDTQEGSQGSQAEVETESTGSADGEAKEE